MLRLWEARLRDFALQMLAVAVILQTLDLIVPIPDSRLFFMAVGGVIGGGNAAMWMTGGDPPHRGGDSRPRRCWAGS